MTEYTTLENLIKAGYIGIGKDNKDILYYFSEDKGVGILLKQENNIYRIIEKYKFGVCKK